MTLWHVQKLYRDNVSGYVVLPYNFRGNIKIENSYKATIRFLWNSRLFRTSADKLCEKRIKNCRQGRPDSSFL